MTFNVTSDSSSTFTLSAVGHDLNKVFASAAPVISNEAEEERETERVAVLPVHDVNEDFVVGECWMVSF